MTCHPAFFTLTYDELLLGENVSDEEFWATYNPSRLGHAGAFAARFGIKAESPEPSTERLVGVSQDSCADSVGSQE